MNNENLLTRFLFDHIPVRGLHVRLDSVWQYLAAQKDYPPAVRRALGEITAAAVLLAANLKFSGSLTIQVQGEGCLKMLVAEATSARTCRATARIDTHAQIADDASLRTLLGENGIFAITLHRDGEEPWQGIVPSGGESIAQMLMHYMKQSEQLDTFIALAADSRAAGGFLLQRLPGKDGGEDAWETATALAQTLTGGELRTLAAPQILHRLFHSDPIHVYAAHAVEFACTCSQQKVAQMLKLLGKKEVEEVIAEQGSIAVHCDFCGTRYVFDEDDTEEIFAE